MKKNETDLFDHTDENLNKFVLFVVFFILLAVQLTVANPATAKDVNILVVAISGVDVASKEWQPTVDFLQNRILTHKFNLIPVIPSQLNHIKELLAGGEIDFVITQPAIYVDLEYQFGISRILTMEKEEGLASFGSVLFTRHDSAVNSLKDIEKKVVAGVARLGFGGWLIGYDEMLSNGIDPYKRAAEVQFLGTQTKVLKAVLRGEVDLGVVRTGIIEKAISENMLQFSDVRVINEKKHNGFSQKISTRLFPEWAFAKSEKVDDDLAIAVAKGLLSIPIDGEEARQGGYYRWTLPYDYREVHELMQRLQVGPFEEFGKITLAGFIEQNKTLVSSSAVSFVFLLIMTVSMFRYRDIFKLKKTEASLRVSEERLKIATDSGQVGIWDFDLQTNELIWDDTMFAIYGARKEDFSGAYDAWSTRLHPEDRAATEAALQDAIAGIKEYDPEFRIVWPDGEEHYIKGYARVIRDSVGKPVRMIGTNWDNKAHALAKQDLQLAHVAINKSNSAFFWFNQDGKLADVNDYACKSLGYSREELTGQHVSFFDPDSSVADWSKFFVEIKKELVLVFESHHRRKDGTVFPVEITANYVSINGKDYFFAFIRDITERKLDEEKIKQLAFYDPLTKLANRRMLQERLKHGIDMAKRDGKQMALLMLDLDRFKTVNDSLGHLAGDEFLQQVAERMIAMLRDVDLVSRLGGDEFTVLLEDISHVDDAARVAREIIIDLSRPFKLTQSDDVKIGASIGISLYPRHGDNPDILLDHADAALYQAKDQGGGCCAYFSEEITRSVRERIAQETRLRNAIEQQELRVFYQPQMDIANGRIIGAEALVRWQDPINGLILPTCFIPIAEDTSLIEEIGEWVLREACKQGRKWLDMRLSPLNLAVNVSARQFQRSNINALVANVLAETGFSAGQLELEITESGLMGNQNNVTDVLNNLRAQGVRLAVDDFGTGYSSLAYLNRFPLDVLKIDKCFIDDIPHDKNDMAIAATIVAMGHTLGFKVMAEGVETREQLAFLLKNNCDYYQGFIKSHAIPAEEFAELVRAQCKG